MHKLSGVFAANVTPFDPVTLDLVPGWMSRHFEFLRANGCNGVVPMGTNGEGPSMSLDERKAVVDMAMEASQGLAVVPGAGCASLPDTAELTRHAFIAGADGVLVVPPFFFKNVTQAGVLEYYRRLCDAALEPGQALLLYHFPKMSAVPIGDEVVAGLEESHPGCVAGIKDSSGDLASVLHWNVLFPRLRVFAGSDTLASEAYKAGLAGTITAGGNVAPNLLQGIRQAVLAGEDPAEIQAQLNRVRSWLEMSPSMHAATKFLLTLFAGLPEVSVRPPLVDLSETQRAELAAVAREVVW